MTDNERKESISALRQLLAMCDFVDQYGDSIDADPYFDAVETAIESLNKTEWISVSEELPKPSQRVGNGFDEDWRISSLIAMKIRGEKGVADSYEIGVAEFSLSGEFDQWYFGNYGWYDKDKVIAWKYVEPYREDGEA